ncbi:E3 ubiquitin-protein ligase HERC2 [Dichotomopilus funicola]|uniref:E3 ubiquitin-protein ligase HERC2 n=1 Tax=Dichotomopilus funicola TaxID=1934379 RepID=A0AAN6V7T2_9PEZI|nr:E3 ubiquitin-protein ligase HERC2 [Dichotomopilus funicola]
MVLYATGFNAWNQLGFDVPGVGESDDFSSFTCVLRDEVEIVRPFLSYTRVHDGHETIHQYPSIHHLLSHISDISHTSQPNFLLNAPKAQNKPPTTFPNLPNITHLLAHDTGFAALSSTGQVYTWGDERYTACLGREPTDESPASTPTPLSSLSDLPTGPITKIAAGGYVLAALTAGNDLYIWGHSGRFPFLGADVLSGTPCPVIITGTGTDTTDDVPRGENEGDEEEKDIIDVAVGNSHILVLTTDGEVFVIGQNGNGQLGVPGVVESTRRWIRVDLDSVLGVGEVVTGVVAGPRSSFLVVEKLEQ